MWSPQKSPHFDSTLPRFDCKLLKQLAPRAGLEPATLRLTGSCRCRFSLVLRWFSPTENLPLPGVREQIVHRLFTGSDRACHDRDERIGEIGASNVDCIIDTTISSRFVAKSRHPIPTCRSGHHPAIPCARRKGPLDRAFGHKRVVPWLVAQGRRMTHQPFSATRPRSMPTDRRGNRCRRRRRIRR
jgi:hypothetical protein